MRFADDLFAQAQHLLTHDWRRPKQASLRRVISTAYYAIFQLLIEESARRMTGNANKPLRQQAQRGFDHGAMRQCCRSFGGGSLPEVVASLLTMPLSAPLRTVARRFALLQDARHDADYDASRIYTRADAEAFVRHAEEAFAAWKTVRGTDEARVFLVTLLPWKSWSRT